jgi:hypothetical protein
MPIARKARAHESCCHRTPGLDEPVEVRSRDYAQDPSWATRTPAAAAQFAFV